MSDAAGSPEVDAAPAPTGVSGAIAQSSGWRRALLAFAAGALSALALPPLYLVPLLVLGLTVLTSLLDGTLWTRSGPTVPPRAGLRRAAVVGWWFGFGFFLVGLYWIGFAFLVDAATYAWMMPFAVVAMPAGLALFAAAAAATARLMWTPGPERIVALAVAWAGFEWLRGHVLTGFPWNLIGYAWSGSIEIVQSTSLFGIYGLSFLTVLFCAAPATLYFGGSRGRGAPIVLGLALTLVAGLWAGGLWRILQSDNAVVDGVTLRLVQPSIPQAEKWRRGNERAVFRQHLDLTAAPGYDRITHVVWPESAVPYVLSREPQLLSDIADVLGSERVLLVGAVRYEFRPGDPDPVYFNALHAIEARPADDGVAPEVTGTFDKFHLVPFGEYLPLAPLLSRIGLRQLAQGAGGFAAGPGPVTLEVSGAPPVSPLICYEIIFPGSVTASDAPRPGWIVNLTNDAWFGDSSGPRQHLALARMRAIESGLAVVRSANNGISAIIDPYGRFLSRLDLNGVGVVDGPLPKALPPTPYDRIGDMLFLAFLICGLSTIGIVRRLDVRT